MVRYLMQMHFVYSGTTPKHTYMDVWKLDMKMVEKKEKKSRSQALSVQNPVWYRDSYRPLQVRPVPNLVRYRRPYRTTPKLTVTAPVPARYTYRI